MSKIFFVLGKSCSGKDTIFQSLKENKQLNLKTVVGYTTRPMRLWIIWIVLIISLKN